MKKALLSCFTAVAILGAAATQADSPAALDLPQIGEPADNTLSPSEEKTLGGRVVAQLYGANYMLEDPELREYISTLGWRLASASQTKPPSLTFFMIRDPRINAFALPGGYIGVNAGLLLAASNESEVAGVLGHELAHVTQRHIARTQEDTQVATVATWLAVIAAIIAGSADPDVVIGALSVGQAMNYQRQVNYTRAHELEADRIGIQTMARAGFDPAGMGGFFSKLEQQSRLYGSGLPEILRTHPLTTNRIAEARGRAAEMPKVVLKESIEFGFMQARARVLTAERPSEAMDHYSNELAAGHDTPTNRYGLALALSVQGQADNADRVLAPLLEKYPRHVTLNLLQARILALQQKNDEALAVLARTTQLYPRYAPALLEYADTMMAAGKPAEARQLLITREQTLGTQLETYNLLAQAARELNNLPEASYQTGVYLFLRGDAGNAIAQLDAGLRLPDLTPQERARLAAKRQEVRDTLPENWRPPRERRDRM
ncbi:M48 family metalloprotease [Solimonas sp. SE-A11]|uniref:M48 family metalloprotease n=1 Tax=Solimonas sp. SE-A11 TaxID=3054954 RepID=UPI00259D1B98|nr:M48 family metalloprotease [Solimonas sp. SE-A11]MDM4771102.1 M48 family metalloprotease [Solimonas sp. SE-A11]